MGAREDQFAAIDQDLHAAQQGWAFRILGRALEARLLRVFVVTQRRRLDAAASCAVPPSAGRAARRVAVARAGSGPSARPRARVRPARTDRRTISRKQIGSRREHDSPARPPFDPARRLCPPHLDRSRAPGQRAGGQWCANTASGQATPSGRVPKARARCSASSSQESRKPGERLTSLRHWCPGESRRPVPARERDHARPISRVKVLRLQCMA